MSRQLLSDDRYTPTSDAADPVEHIVTELTSILAGLGGLDVDELDPDAKFTELGLDSLSLVQAGARCRKRFGVRVTLGELLGETMTVAALAERIAAELGPAGLPASGRPTTIPAQGGGAAAMTDDRPPDSDEGRRLPLTDVQRDVWVVCQWGDAGSTAYNISTLLRLQGALDIEVLHRSLRELVRRHEALRTTFDEAGGHQLVQQGSDPGLPIVDISDLPRGEQARRVSALLDTDMATPYDLVNGPLFRPTLIRFGPADHSLVLAAHHLVCDGWSFEVMKRDLGAIYSSLVAGERIGLVEATQFSEYVAWHANQGADAEAYWLGLYKAPPVPLDLPTDKARPPVRSFEFGSHRGVIDGELLAELREFALAQGVTPFIVFLAAWEIMLHRLSGQVGFAAGAYVAGQASMGAPDLVGFCANHPALLVDIVPDEPLRDFLTRLQRTTTEALDNQHYSIGRLFSALKLTRDASRPSVISTGITLETLDPMGGFADLEAVGQNHGRRSYGTLDLEAYLAESDDDEVVVDFQYPTELFEPSTIERWLDYYTTLLREMTADPATPVSSLRLLSDEDHERLRRWNHTAQPYPEQVVHALFDVQASETPDRPALIFEGEELTYAELARRSNQLAHFLVGKGVTTDVPVGVALPRSPDAIVAMLAVMKAGGAYVPLDPGYPSDRLAMMLEDADVGLVLTATGVAQLPRSRAELVDMREFDGRGFPDHAPEIASSPDDTLYITFTSGSTGRPKGVMGTHRGLVNRCHWQWQTYPFAEGEVCCQKTSLNFVDHLWETWGPLLKGHALVIVPDDVVIDAGRFVDLLAEHQVERLVTVPSFLSALIRAVPDIGARLPRLRYCTLSGERLTGELATELASVLPETVLLNFYGMSEGSGDATWYDGRWAAHSERIPIGRPIHNTRVYVLDSSGAPVPPGVTGEIHVGGVGVAKGYRGRPDLTDERFLPDPFVEDADARMYRSGDLARWSAEGLLEFVGRVDQQVKVRGIRIELGDIEAALRSLDDVDDAAVSVRTIGQDRQLVAYAVPADDAPSDPAALRAALARTLPEYMVPARVIYLPALPLTPSGKLDRASLPDFDGQRPDLAAELILPRTPAEATLARIWEELLVVERVGVHDRFFDLGGDSLLAIRCVTQANRVGLVLTPMALFRHQTIAELAAVAMEAAGVGEDDQGVVTGPTPLSPAQLRFLHERQTPDPHHWNIAELVTAERLSPAALRTAVDALVLHHDALRLRLWQEEGSWRQETAAPSEETPFESHDLTGVPADERPAAIERVCTALQSGFDLGRGLLLKVAHFDCGPDEPDRLFVTIHHFAVDGVSWSVFWEDLEQAYRQAATSEPVSLPPKTTSIKTWATQLERMARSPRIAATAPMWLRQPWHEVSRLPAEPDADPGSNTNSSTAVVELELSPHETRRLLRGRQRPDHIIITALARCLSGWTASPTVLMDVLGHGRDAVIDGVNLSRTVGFTLSYQPLVLRHPTWDDSQETLASVASQIAALPEGSSFELLRFMAPDEDLRDRLTQLPRAEILFNYRGVDSDHEEDSMWPPAPEPSGPSDSPRGLRQYPIAVLAAGTTNLRLTFIYSTNLHAASTIEAKAAEVMATVRALLEDPLVAP